MRDFSIGEAGLVGFRLTRERPRAIGVWCVLNLVFSFVTLLVLVGVGGEAMSALQASAESPGAAQDPAATMAAFNQLLPAYGLFLLLWLAFSAVMAAAASRAVLRPQEDGLGYVRFGAEEVRVILALAAIGLILFFAYLAAILVMGIVLGVLIGATGGGGAAAGAGLALALVPVVLLALLWLWTRFSLAVPLTLARGRVDVFGSWAMTKGRSGKVFLTYLLAFGLYLLVAVLGVAIFLGVGAAISGSAGPMEAVMKADMSSIGAYFNPLTITYTVVMSVIGALGSAIVLCPPAVIYRELAGEDVHEVF
ncbi:hypothetical protein [Phenylobacterium sp.]|jgi:hypothetical protein|uniref:hypothetical protein n=1 Tax=Phenylobacterium sp. TaxID=1871053 RepID=UPI002E381583|nr:hypothetical protein [Phenylobacterium sp.]HEX2559718.1 hypothetical protein [Phenylobacterium sp.]